MMTGRTNVKKLIKTAEDFSHRKVNSYCEFPKFYLCFTEGWDGIVKCDKETGKASTFYPPDVSAEEYRKYASNMINV